MLLVSAIVAANGLSLISAIAAIAGAALVFPKNNEVQTRTKTEHKLIATNPDIEIETPSSTNRRLYRSTEMRRIKASLLASGSILVVGEEGSGKSVLATSVYEQLQTEGFNVAFIEPATAKQMLLEIAQQLGIDSQNLEGKALTADQLKRAIASHFDTTTAFLIVDNAQQVEAKFRMWLKQLRKQGVPMLLLASNPTRSDIFISIPRIMLAPLPEYAIRELMELAALERGISLNNSQLAKLQERVGGNPMMAQRVIDEEYLGLEVETGDHTRYFDMTPVILLVGVVFAVMRFMALGTHNSALYILTGAGGALFMGASYAMRALPKEGRKIQ